MDNELRIGVAGLGAIGRTHIDRINCKLRGGRVTAVTDLAVEFGGKAAAGLDLPFFDDIRGMLASNTVDALVVTAADDHHEHYVMAAVKAGLPVFCEKPLAPGAEACRRIVEAEMAGGRRLVQVGFMRRYDPGYRQLKALVDSGKYGLPLMLHCAHRNFEAGENTVTPMAVSNSLIHEIDVMRWLAGEDYATVEMAFPKCTRHTHKKLLDPQILILTSKSGVRMDVEWYGNSRVGYDIQCEVCCEDGFLRLPGPPSVSVVTDAGRVVPICRDWSERFVEAYNIEIQEWLDATRQGRVDGPNAWDGYIAAITADAAQKARESGTVVKIDMPARPRFYA